MKISLLITLFALISCASKPQKINCPEAATQITLKKSEAKKIQGNVSQFLTDAQITQEHNKEGDGSIWRFTHMPSDSIYHQIGLREGDAVTKTNLGVQNSSINLISDLSGIATGTTNCLWVKDKQNTERVIKVLVEKK